MELNRKQKILKLIIEDFIRYAEPVGSNYLLNKYKLPYSSATIRNEMADLEKDGFLEKTHIASGRVPTTKAYKYYVETLRKNKIDEKSKQEIQSIFNSSKSIEDVVKESCRILSSLTNLTSVLIGPNSNSETLLNIKLVPINQNSCSAIFITDTGYVEHKTFILEEDVSLNDLMKCIEMLDKRLKGTKITDLVDKLESLKPIFIEYISDYNYLYTSLLKTFSEFAKERSSFYGKENMLSQPEFKDDVNELKKIFDFFSNPDKLSNFLASTDRSLILDASEVSDEFKDIAIISKDIETNGASLGKIAIIGPKRMDYGNVLSMLEYTINELIKHLESFYDDK